MKDNGTKVPLHPQFNPTQLAAFLEVMCFGENRGVGEERVFPTPVMIWGEGGGGKSSVIKQLAKKFGRELIDVRLNLKEPTDISGQCYFDTNAGKLKVATPVGFPEIGNPAHAHLMNAVIVLEELSSAPESVQAASLQLVLDRRVGDYILPPDCIIVACSNRADDGNVFSEMPVPLRNRFAHVDLVPSYEQWKRHAESVDMHPLVLAYLESCSGIDFRVQNQSTLDGVYAFPTGRSWERVSENLWSITDRSTFTIKQENMVAPIVSSLVGAGIANKLVAYMKTFSKLPKPSEILDGSITKYDFSAFRETEQQNARYALVLGLSHLLRERYRTIINRAKEVGQSEGAKLKNEFIDNECTKANAFLISNLGQHEEMLAVAARHIVRAAIPATAAFAELLDITNSTMNDI